MGFLEVFAKGPTRGIYLALERMASIIPDEQYLKLMYRIRLGTKLNRDEPKRYTEKIQWLKLYDRNPEYARMVDKYLVKEYVSEKIGPGHSIPTIGIFDGFDDIDFDKLPPDYVIKCTHDSGSFVICRKGESRDYKKLKKHFNKALKRDYYYSDREWPYKCVKPRIMIEPFMEDAEGENLTDYKFFCFNGIPQIMYISKDGSGDPHTDFYDMGFNHLNLTMRDPNSEIPPKKPEHFDKMREYAEVLSQGIPHIRIDFYCIDDVIYVGELTFCHNGGFSTIKPIEWDCKLGEYIDIERISSRNNGSRE